MHRDQEDIDAFVRGERIGQKFMDPYYISRGFTVDRSTSCHEYDVMIACNGREYKVEEKYRAQDYGDLLLELFQCLEEPQLGWIYHTRADTLNYIICDKDWQPEYFYCVTWRPFKKWLFDVIKHQSSIKTIVSPKGIGISLNMAIEWAIIPQEYWTKNTLEKSIP